MQIDYKNVVFSASDGRVFQFRKFAVLREEFTFWFRGERLIGAKKEQGKFRFKLDELSRHVPKKPKRKKDRNAVFKSAK